MSGSSNANYLKMSDFRYLAQKGGSVGTNPVLYAGESKDFWITGSSKSNAATTTDYGQDPIRPNEWVAIGTTRAQPTDSTFTINSMRSKGEVSAFAFIKQCFLTIYRMSSDCGILDDVYGADWPYLEIWSNGVVNGNETTTDDSNTSTDFVIDQLPMTTRYIYTVTPVNFGAVTAAALASLNTLPVVDVAYFGFDGCDDCDGAQTGTSNIAVLSDDAFAGADGQLSYSTDGGSTFSTITLTSNAGDRAFVGVDVIGANALIIPYQSQTTDPGHVYIPVSGNVLGTPQYISCGCVLGVPTDLTVSGRTVYTSGLNGYIYRNTSGTGSNLAVESGAITDSDFRRIHSDGKTIVAVGNENAGGSATTAVAVVYSTDGGDTWSAATNPTGWGDAGFYLSSVWVHSKNQWDVGTSTGVILRTLDGGSTWATLYDSGLANPVTDIAYPTDETGYASILDGANITMHYTVTSGEAWRESALGARIGTYTNVASIEDDSGVVGAGQVRPSVRLSFPCAKDFDIRSNYVVMGGPATATSGLLQIATPST